MVIGYVFYSGAADRIIAYTWLAGGLVTGKGPAGYRVRALKCT